MIRNGPEAPAVSVAAGTGPADSALLSPPWLCPSDPVASKAANSLGFPISQVCCSATRTEPGHRAGLCEGIAGPASPLWAALRSSWALGSQVRGRAGAAALRVAQLPTDGHKARGPQPWLPGRPLPEGRPASNPRPG